VAAEVEPEAAQDPGGARMGDRDIGKQLLVLLVGHRAHEILLAGASSKVAANF
jgi:hypothetical protein